MRAFSYVVETDSGFAPNPFWGICTLATCKPEIRKVAQVGDWVFGWGSASMKMTGRLIFAMRVDEVVSFDLYDRDPRFQCKKPSFSRTPEERCGDNIYYRDVPNHWAQRECFHCDDDLKTDLGGVNVLISEYFWYFGKKASFPPTECTPVTMKGRGHKANIPDSAVSAAIEWLVESGVSRSNSTLSPSEVRGNQRGSAPTSIRSPRPGCLLT